MYYSKIDQTTRNIFNRDGFAQLTNESKLIVARADSVHISDLDRTARQHYNVRDFRALSKESMDIVLKIHGK